MQAAGAVAASYQAAWAVSACWPAQAWAPCRYLELNLSLSTYLRRTRKWSVYTATLLHCALLTLLHCYTAQDLKVERGTGYRMVLEHSYLFYLILDTSILRARACAHASCQLRATVALAVAGLATLRPKFLASNMRGRAFLRRFQRQSRLP